MNFFQAAYGQALKKGAAMKRNKTRNARRHHIIKKFLVIPLLPPEFIQGAFDKIVEECEGHGNYFKNYIEYFRKEWINKWKVGRISVYGIRDRTNNKIETYHKKIHKRFGIRPPPRHFISKSSFIQKIF